MSVDIEKYIAKLPAGEQGICKKLHAVILVAMPGVHCMIHYGVPGYSYTPSGFDRICYIMPQSSWVNLGFFFGADIPDPRKLLTGTGKRMRHIKIYTAEDAANPAIIPLLKTAWKKAGDDMRRFMCGRKNKVMANSYL